MKENANSDWRGLLLNRLEVAVSISRAASHATFWTGSVCFLVFLFGALSSDGWAQRRNQIARERPFRESASLPTDSNLLKRFGTVEGLISDQRWVEAIGIVQEIAQNEGQSLVLVEPGVPGGAATYTNVATRCNVLLSHIPEEGRKVYRQRTDAQAKRWFEHWLQTRDQTHLLKIIRQAFLSSYGDDALLALGEVAWDHEDYSSARQWWEQMLPLDPAVDVARYPTVLRYPDSQLERPQILARLILCSILGRETQRAESELRQFEELHAGAGGWLAGRQGRLAEILRDTLNESKTWNRTSKSGETSTFAMSPQRSSVAPDSLDVGALRWARPLPSKVIMPSSGKQPLPPTPLSYHPVVYDHFSDKIVFVNDADCIRAWNLYTGEPAWASAGHDPSIVYPSIVETLTMRIDRDSVGVPNYTMTIADDRLYARMGTPVTSSSSAELRRDPVSDLICLDLKQEGRLVWKVASHELMLDDGSWQFEGSPVVVQGRAYVAMCRRHPQLELMVVCLDASDGRRQWQKSLGGFRSVVEESKNRISHLLLTHGGGKVFLSTDAGAIVALDAFDGRLEWAITYESRIEDLIATRPELYTSGVRPCLYHAGLVFAAPTDSNAAFCIEADSGRLQWLFPFTEVQSAQLNETNRRARESQQIRNREWRHLLGVVPGGAQGRLVVSGNALWWIDVETGRIARVRNDSILPGGGKENFGRGLIAGDQILVPSRETIEFFNAQSGEPTRSVLLKSPDSEELGGNLVLADDMLLVAQTNRLSAYGEFSLLKQRLEKRLIQRPNDRDLLLRLAELEASDGRVTDAIDRIRAILPQFEGKSPALDAVKGKLCLLTRKAGAAAFESSNFDEARRLWQESLELMTDPAATVELIFDVAKLDERLEQPERAIESLQRILLEDRLAHFVRDMRSARSLAQAEIEALITRYGNDAYKSVEAQARARYQTASSANNIAGLQQLIAAFPNSTIRDQARIRIAELSRGAGEMLEACSALDEIRRSHPNSLPDQYRLLKQLEEAHATDIASELWARLASVDPSVEIDFDGKRTSVSRLAKEKGQALRHPVSTQSSFLERTWSYRLPEDVHVTIPRGRAPSSEKEVILISYRLRPDQDSWTWKCLDWTTGQLRWQSSEARQIETAVWSPYRLMIGTSHGWQARTADQGRVVWNHPAANRCRPVVIEEPDSAIEAVGWLGLFRPERGLTFLDPSNGAIVSIVKPVGQLHDRFAVGYARRSRDASSSPQTYEQRAGGQRDERPRIVVVMQTVNPTRQWLLHARHPQEDWTVSSDFHRGEPWGSDPFIVDEWITGVTQDHRLLGCKMNVGFEQAEPADVTSQADRLRRGDFWFDNNLPTGFGTPIAFPIGGELLTVADGSRLSSIELGSGRRKWTVGIADSPMMNPGSQICTDGATVFATGQGWIRSISVNDGTTRFARFLGDASPQWKTVCLSRRIAPIGQHHPSKLSDDQRPTIAAWPTEVEDPRHNFIWLIEADSGSVIQQLRTDGEQLGIQIDEHGRGVVWTKNAISGLEFASLKSIE